MCGTLFVVATPIGNLEDITVRALAVLRRVQLIAAEDTRRTARLLARYDIGTRTTSLHEHNERRKAAAIVARLQQGDSVALVTDAGTPTVSDPGGHLIDAAIQAGIRIEPIPGASAALAALMASGLPTETFAFLGFPPVKGRDRSAWFDRLRAVGGTVVFFEAPHRIAATLQELHAFIGDRRVAVARELTKAHEELVRGPISEVLTHFDEPRGEFTVVVEVGHTTAQPETAPPGDLAILAEFGRRAENAAGNRRSTVAAIARKYRLSTREVYAAIERGKTLGKQQNG